MTDKQLIATLVAEVKRLEAENARLRTGLAEAGETLAGLKEAAFNFMQTADALRDLKRDPIAVFAEPAS